MFIIEELYLKRKTSEVNIKTTPRSNFLVVNHDANICCFFKNSLLCPSSIIHPLQHRHSSLATAEQCIPLPRSKAALLQPLQAGACRAEAVTAPRCGTFGSGAVSQGITSWWDNTQWKRWYLQIILLI